MSWSDDWFSQELRRGDPYIRRVAEAAEKKKALKKVTLAQRAKRYRERYAKDMVFKKKEKEKSKRRYAELTHAKKVYDRLVKAGKI